jgi:hypothetical protein
MGIYFSWPPLHCIGYRYTFFWEEKGFTGQGHAEANLDQRDAPGQDTGRSQGHLSSYLLGGAPGEGTGQDVSQTADGTTHIAED